MAPLQLVSDPSALSDALTVPPLAFYTMQMMMGANGGWETDIRVLHAVSRASAPPLASSVMENV